MPSCYGAKPDLAHPCLHLCESLFYMELQHCLQIFYNYCDTNKLYKQ